ncbi:hypothetical protein [Streptomyces sp. A012304]|jgi:hypothetical protein|uniref:hypothetical protein n=1 Tax=Streptomyces sp. A012304 TaxID=375446 RepID=UPI0022304678|nr:hypothetical protein [Streptomyces sp. A012304]GKQ35208.1 hypothetical protein ALMP_17540 [Streptomyces sp. A012304]
MSSPLDGRIRRLAREEAAALLDITPTADGSTDADQVAALDLKVTELTGIVERLNARLDALEKTTSQTDQEARPAARRTRKATGE